MPGPWQSPCIPIRLKGIDEESPGLLATGPGKAGEVSTFHRSRVWYLCRPAVTAGSLDCPIDLEEPRTGRVIEAVEVPVLNPAATRLRVGDAGHVQRQVPAALLVARDSVVDVPVQPDVHQDIAVLADVDNRRVLLGPPPFSARLRWVWSTSMALARRSS